MGLALAVRRLSWPAMVAAGRRPRASASWWAGSWSCSRTWATRGCSSSSARIRGPRSAGSGWRGSPSVGGRARDGGRHRAAMGSAAAGVSTPSPSPARPRWRPWSPGAAGRPATSRWQSRARITAQVQAGLEQERTRIAADMHDLVAHTWAVVAAQADGARYALGAAPRATARRRRPSRSSPRPRAARSPTCASCSPSCATRSPRPRPAAGSGDAWSSGCAPRGWTSGSWSRASRRAPGCSRWPPSGCSPSRSPTRSSTATWPTRSRSRRTGATATVWWCATGSAAPPRCRARATASTGMRERVDLAGGTFEAGASGETGRSPPTCRSRS